MFSELYKNEEDFKDNCPCAYTILSFVDGIKDTDVRWFFDIGYCHDYKEDRYSIIFKSYVTEEYKDYILSVEAKKNPKTKDYDLRVIKKVDNLVK